MEGIGYDCMRVVVREYCELGLKTWFNRVTLYVESSDTSERQIVPVRARNCMDVHGGVGGGEKRATPLLFSFS